jgi:hypothetical protein
MEKSGVEYVHPVTYLNGSSRLSQQDEEEITWTTSEETAVRRKLDYHIVPLVTLLYLLCFVRILAPLSFYILTKWIPD